MMILLSLLMYLMICNYPIPARTQSFEIPYQCRRQKCEECVFEARCHYDLPLFNSSAECKKTDCEQPEKDPCPPNWENDRGERGVCYHHNLTASNGSTFLEAKHYCENYGGILPQFEENFNLRRFLSTKLYASTGTPFYIGLSVGKDRFSWLASRFTLVTDVSLSKVFGAVLKANLTRSTPSKPERDCIQIDPVKRLASLVPCQTRLASVVCMLTIDHCRILHNASLLGYPLYRPPSICSNNGECQGTEECTQYNRLGYLYCCPKALPGYVKSGVDPRIKSETEKKDGGLVIRRLVPPPNGSGTPTRIIASSSVFNRNSRIQKFLANRA